jgi:hypothetical protein
MTHGELVEPGEVPVLKRRKALTREQATMVYAPVDTAT